MDNANSSIKVSILIPVYKDQGRLKLCLQCLESQTFSKSIYEIIIIDNHLSPKIELESKPYLRLIHEPKPGSYAARNAGLKAASGEIVAFTDADCQPASDWLEQAVRSLEVGSPNTIVAGSIQVIPKQIGRPSFAECYDIAIGLRQDRYVKLGGFAATANLVAYKYTFDQVGYFDDVLKSGGDYEWGKRARDAGYVFAYCPTVVVYHPARESIAEIIKKARRTSGGMHDLSKRNKKARNAKNMRGIKSTPCKTLQDIFRDSNLPRLHHKLSAMLIAVLVIVVRVDEKVSLALGRVSRRS